VIPKILKARDCIRTHNDIEQQSLRKNKNGRAGFGSGSGPYQQMQAQQQRESVDFKVSRSLCATTAAALDACANELEKCANAAAVVGASRVLSTSGRIDDVMELRCVFLGRSGVGKSHVVNAFLRRACVPSRSKRNGCEKRSLLVNKNDNLMEQKEEEEEEEEKKSYGEDEDASMEGDDDDDGLLEILGKQQDIMGLMGMDEDDDYDKNNSDSEEPASFMVDDKDEMTEYLRHERFKIEKIEYGANKNVETLEESVSKARSQAQERFTQHHSEENRCTQDIEEEIRQKILAETREYAEKIPVCEDEKEIKKKMEPKAVSDSHEKNDFLLCEGDVGDTTSVSCAATLGNSFKLEIRYHSSKFVQERVEGLRNILRLKEKKETTKSKEVWFFDHRERRNDNSEEESDYCDEYYDACIDERNGTLKAEAASACAMTGHEPYASNLNNIEIEDVTIPKILIDRLNATITFAPPKTHEHLKETLAYFEASVKMFRSTLREETTHGCWGCVRDVTITLPCINPIYRGITFVDAPGAGESDPARMDQLRKELSNADAVFIVADARRIPDDVRKALKKSEFLRKVTEEPDRFKIISVMQADRCFDGLNSVCWKAAAKIEYLKSIAENNDDDLRVESDDYMDCESQECNDEHKKDKRVDIEKSSKSSASVARIFKQALKHSLPSIDGAQVQNGDDEAEEKLRLRTAPPTGFAALAAISEVHKANAKIVAKERFNELLNEIQETRGSPPELTEYAKALKATLDRSKQRPSENQSNVDKFIDDDLRDAFEKGGRFRQPEAKAALHQSWTFVSLSISWAKVLRESLLDDDDDDNDEGNIVRPIEAAIDEICGFSRIDRALLEFLPKNALKRATHALDLASKVLEQFCSQASPIANIHCCADSEVRALQEAILESFGENAQDVAAKCGAEAARIASSVAVASCDKIIHVYERSLYENEEMFKFDRIFAFISEKNRTAQLRKTQKGELLSNDLKTFAKICRNATREFLCEDKRLTSWTQKAAKDAVEIWLQNWNSKPSGTEESFREKSASAALQKLFNISRSADYENNGEFVDHGALWVQQERMLNMSADEIREEQERQKEASMNTPLETIVRSKVRESISKTTTTTTTNANANALDAQMFFKLPKNFFPLDVPNGSVQKDLEKRLRQAYLTNVDLLLDAYEETSKTYIKEMFSFLVGESDYEVYIRDAIAGMYSNLMTSFVYNLDFRVRVHAERFFMETFLLPVRQHVESKVSVLLKPLTVKMVTSAFRNLCVKKAWINRSQKDANLAQKAKQACVEFSKAASLSLKDSIERTSNEKKLRKIERDLVCLKLPPFFDDSRAFVSIADCCIAKDGKMLDVIDYGLETKVAIDELSKLEETLNNQNQSSDDIIPAGDNDEELGSIEKEHFENHQQEQQQRSGSTNETIPQQAGGAEQNTDATPIRINPTTLTISLEDTHTTTTTSNEIQQCNSDDDENRRKSLRINMADSHRLTRREIKETFIDSKIADNLLRYTRNNSVYIDRG